MSLNPVDYSLPDNFENVVRLFPLPNLVLFPGVIQALHIFEPRYRQLMTDSLNSDELITMALVKPGLQSELAVRPDIFPTVCIGKIVTHAKLDDGRFNLLLLGAKRARIIRELDSPTPYRMAEIELCPDYLDLNQADSEQLRERITCDFRNLAQRRPQLDQESIDQLLTDDLPLGQLIDLIGYSCNASPAEQQRLLATPDVGKRGRLLLRLLESQAENCDETESSAQPPFPPDFSLN